MVIKVEGDFVSLAWELEGNICMMCNTKFKFQETIQKVAN